MKAILDRVDDLLGVLGAAAPLSDLSTPVVLVLSRVVQTCGFLPKHPQVSVQRAVVTAAEHLPPAEQL